MACYNRHVPSSSSSPRTPSPSAQALTRAFDLYIFDLDGTLVDSRMDLAAAVNFAREALGLSALSLATVSGYVGEGVAKLMERSLGPEHSAHLDEATELFRAHYGAHLVVHTRAYEGAAQVLQTLRNRGARVAVATNKPERFSRVILERLGLMPHVEALVGGDSLPQRKPDPLPLLTLCSNFEIAPGRTLMVGDSPIDARAARAAGVSMCAVTYGIGTRAELLAQAPDFVSESTRGVLEAGARV